MYLKSLTLTGFKSFQKRTTIDFCPQINGVIGPNGSGKSNLLEAIRFAMGEQSGKSFRGNTMKDVIFSGSETEKALNRAKVELVLDNSDHLLAEFGDQVEVSRTIYRDGTSDYQINHQNVRQKDVQSLFLGAGLGRDTMAFINQGKVQNIIDSDPIARRGVFEEVAGVYKYKLNRREAVSNLEATDFEVQRLKDLLFELNNNLKPLAIESERATEYSNLKELYDRLHLFGVVNKIKKLVEQRETKEKQEKSLSTKISTLEEIIKDNKLALENANQEASEKQQAQDDLQQKLVAVIKERETLSSDHQVLLTKNDQAKIQIQDFTNRIQELAQSCEDCSKKQEQIKQQIADLNDELATKKKEQGALAEKSGATVEELNHELDAAKDRYFDLLNEQTAVKNKLNVLENSQNSIKRLIADRQKRIDEKRSILNDLKQNQQRLHQVIADYEQAQNNAQENIEKIAEQQAELLNQQDKLSQELAQHNNERQLLTSQIRDLKNQERSLNGVFEGVKAVIQNAERLNGIIGTIFQLVTVPVKYQKALSEALGTRFQNIVTVDEKSAKEAIQFLKRANKGRATFYPLDRIQEQDFSDTLKEKLAQVPGFLGVAIDLIDFDPKYRNVISNFFGRLIIAKDLDQGTQIAHLTQNRYRIVTLDGDLINIGGSMTGGKSNTRNDYFRSSEIKTKEKALADVEQQIISIKQKAQQFKDQLSQIGLDLTNEKNAQQAKRTEIEKTKQDLAQVDAQSNSVKEQIEELNLEIFAQRNQEQGDDELAKLKEQLAENANQISIFDTKIATINEQIEKRLQEDNSGVRSELEASIATLRERKLNFQERLKEQIDQLHQYQNEKAANKEKIDDLEAKISEYQEQIAVAAKKLEESTKKETDLAQEKNDLVTASQGIEENRAKLNQELEKEQLNHDQLAQELNALSVQTARFKVQLDSLLDDLANDYEMTYEGALKFVSEHELTAEEQKSDLKALQKKLRDFGNVNLEAVNEYQKLKERVEFSEQQLNDVLQARQELQESIDKLDDQVRKLFGDAFNAVNEAFQEIYPAMFNGGTAELKLTEPDDLLKTGVEIVAAPPGKKTRSLSLLSGGEKSLSAITLLFAIIKVSTVPFSILDEVEAALDDANVDRFSQYLEQFNGRTQFIVITHRRSTMRAAQRLFGVTMIGTGISKMVSVKLDEISKE
ncbi:chromosome segregation protein SMC [Xylocopilactobacillus apicola]|uniref:Chromosome partition protein Smc n=1 Tax=Xylocopilactobacillus apicola TaxID=2932184 RepID=A0AAU9DQK5_9LACO|nr:chromosome segregation protein SMC [Xylocopilactobacillus apicola]BDR58174.1 chromosome partition protein Smc [Xylocopilactobacillus apicola]